MPATNYKYQIYSAIKTALAELTGTTVVDGSPFFENKNLTGSKVLGVCFSSETWELVGTRVHCEATYLIDGFYENAYGDMENYLSWLEDVIEKLNSEWDYDLGYIKKSYIAVIRTAAGLMQPHGSFSIELRVQYYREARGF